MPNEPGKYSRNAAGTYDVRCFQCERSEEFDCGVPGVAVAPKVLRRMGWSMDGRTNAARWRCPKHNEPTMPNPDMRDLVEVTQADRERARPWLYQCLSRSDLLALTESFAAHRIAAEAECAARVERLATALDRAVQMADRAGVHWPADPYEGIK